jgi:predicted DNA-binding protein (UPF0251 family)
LSVNNVDARGLSHAHVVNQVVKGGGILDLIVLRVDEQEALRLQKLEDAASNKKGKVGLISEIVRQDGSID